MGLGPKGRTDHYYSRPVMTSSRARWLGVWALIALWLVALAFNVGGSLAHLLLVGGIALLVFELLVEEPKG